MKSNKNLILGSLIIAVIGYGAVSYFANWQTSLGIFLIHWAANIEHRIKTNEQSTEKC